MPVAPQQDGFDPRLMPDAGSRDIINFASRRLAQRRVEPIPPDEGDA
jgi:hypothetical protein